MKVAFAYVKPYTTRIDILMMLVDHKPPKFQHVDGKINSKKHVAYFLETCNNAGTYGCLLFK